MTGENLADLKSRQDRSLANGDFDLRDEDLAAHPAGNLRRVSRLEEKLEGLLEIRAHLLEL